MNPEAQEVSVVAIYETHQSAEAAVKALQAGGMDMQRLSIVGRDFHTEEHALGFYTTGDRMKLWGGRGALWGALWGSFIAAGVFLLPAVGPLVVLGPLVGWIVGALEGAAVGGTTGVIAAALSGIGIPEDSVVKYESSVKAGSYVLLARGTPDMIDHAHAVLGTTGATHLLAHGSSSAQAATGLRRLLVPRPSLLDGRSCSFCAKAQGLRQSPIVKKRDVRRWLGHTVPPVLAGRCRGRRRASRDAVPVRFSRAGQPLMRSSSPVRSFPRRATAAAMLLGAAGCATFADLPDYKLAPAGEAGAAGAIGGAAGRETGGTASGVAGAHGGGKAGGHGGSAGDGSTGSGGPGGVGTGGGPAGFAGEGGGGGAAGSAVGGAGSSSGEAGAAGGGGTGGAGGKGGTSGATGDAGGAAGSAGSPAGTGGIGGNAAGAGGDAGQAGAKTVEAPEIIATAQPDPGTILLEKGMLYWVNRNRGASGEVRSLPLPGATPNPLGSGLVVPVVTAVKDIALLGDRLFVLRGAGVAEQSLLTSYGTDGTDAVVAQRCADGASSAACTVTSVNRLVGAQNKVFFSGAASGSAGSNATYAGTKACTAAVDSCRGVIAETLPASAMTTVGDTLFSVPAEAPTQVKQIVGVEATLFMETLEPVVDLATDGVKVFVLTQGGRVFAKLATGGVVATLVPGSVGARPQRLAVSETHVYWTALGASVGEGIVGRVARSGGSPEILSNDRGGPLGIAIDDTGATPHVYFTDLSDTVQRIRVRALP